MTMSESPAILSSSPSLSIYSSNRLSDIAARVIKQLRLQEQGTETDSLDDDNYPFSTPRMKNNEEDEDEDEDEEFTFACQPQYTSPTPADQIFCDGRIRTAYAYPVFVLGREESGDGGSRETKKGVLRLPLGKFLMEERESSPSWCSSEEEEEELEGAEPGSYCVWRPENTSQVNVQESCRKSRSSRRWSLRKYLVLKRSTSDGDKDGFVILRRSKECRGGQN